MNEFYIYISDENTTLQIDATLSVDDMLDIIQENLSEDWTITDHEGFEQYDLDMTLPLSEISEIVEYLQEYEHSIDIASELLNSKSLSTAKDMMENYYMGCYNSFPDFVETDYPQIYEIPEHLENYIDWQAVTNDWIHDFITYDIDCNTHVFRNC